MLHRLTPSFLAIIIATLSLPFAADASRLEWDQTEARIELKPGEEQARATFTVTNKGEVAVRIAKVKTSCGCTGSIVDKRILKPGESAEIIGTFNKGKRQGLNHNKLQVFLDSLPNAVATLHMIVQVPQLVVAQPQIVYWNPRTSKNKRTVQLILDKRYVNEIESIEYDHSQLTVTEEADPNGKAERILHVRPKSFDVQIRETITVNTRGPDGMKAEARILLFVQP
jgi:hypothetical protein